MKLSNEDIVITLLLLVNTTLVNNASYNLLSTSANKSVVLYNPFVNEMVYTAPPLLLNYN